MGKRFPCSLNTVHRTLNYLTDILFKGQTELNINTLSLRDLWAFDIWLIGSSGDVVISNEDFSLNDTVLCVPSMSVEGSDALRKDSPHFYARSALEVSNKPHE